MNQMRIRQRVIAHIYSILADLEDNLLMPMNFTGNDSRYKARLQLAGFDDEDDLGIPIELLKDRWLPEEIATLVILSGTRRYTQAEIHDQLRAQGFKIGEGPLKSILARMGRLGDVGNDRSSRNPGYLITERTRVLIKALLLAQRSA